MQLRSRLAATSVAVIPLLALLAAPAALLAADPPVTLRFAVADEEGRPSDPYVRAFVQEVAAPLRWLGDPRPDLGTPAVTTSSRASRDSSSMAGRPRARGRPGLGVAGISSLQALQAPFLIDSDELAEAVATDPLMEPLLAAMGEGGVAGLAVWPEDLRHPVAFEPCMGAHHVADRPPGPDRASHRLGRDVRADRRRSVRPTIRRRLRRPGGVVRDPGRRIRSAPGSLPARARRRSPAM